MTNKVKKTDNHFPEVPSAKGWLVNRFLELLNLLKMIRFRYSFQSIKVQVLWLLIYSFIYPFPRIILGEEKACKICRSFINICFPLIILSLSPQLKSKIILYEHGDFGNYIEIYVCNIYFHETLRKGMNVIDIGANIGVYTILAAEKVGETGKVIAIEPEPENYKLLLKNIKLNNFQNVTPKNIALAGQEGSGKLYLNSSDSGGHSLIFQEDKDSPYINVQVKTIDKLLDGLGIKRIDIIKIDTEGAEMSILKGAEKTLKANPNMKIIVAAEHYPSQIKEVRQFLKNKGFKTKVSSKNIVMTI